MDKNDLKRTLTAISNTLEGLEIRATFDNLERLTGCQQELHRLIREVDLDGNNNDE